MDVPEPEPKQAQESNLEPLNEVISTLSLQDETEFHMDSDDQNLPLVITKGTKEFINQPIYPLAHPSRYFHHSIKSLPCKPKHYKRIDPIATVHPIAPSLTESPSCN